MPAKRKNSNTESASNITDAETEDKQQKTEDSKPTADGEQAPETSAASVVISLGAEPAAEEPPKKSRRKSTTAGRKSSVAGRRSMVGAPLAAVDPALPPHLRQINWRDLDFIGAESPETAASLKREPWRFDTMNAVLSTGELAGVNGLQIWMYPEPHQPDVSEGKVIDVPVIYAVDCPVRTNEITKANIQGAINTIEQMGPQTFYWDPYFNSRFSDEYKGTPPHVVLKAGRTARHAKDSEKDKYQRQFYMPFIRLPQLQETYEQLTAKHTNVTAEIPIERWLIKKTLPEDVAAKDVPKLVSGIMEQALRDNTRMAPKDATKLRSELRQALLQHINDEKEGEFRFESQHTKYVEVTYEKGVHYTSEIAEELKDDEGWINDNAQSIVKDAVHAEFEKLRASLRQQVDDAEKFFAALQPDDLAALKSLRVYKFYPVRCSENSSHGSYYPSSEEGYRWYFQVPHPPPQGCRQASFA
eukprot:TRINITY_DN379_c0_g1_i1.p1 TRINITY_DN379_c0_g1~~TRINITY_DN379_c0_g1_i1.p1  ORF type:complete len:472 (-),score=188.24 TRINITY_DN379_c0_g1_i1:893-2308(-)